MKKTKKFSSGSLFLTCFFAVLSILWMIPIFEVIINSFKGNAFINLDPFALPTEESFAGIANYIKAFTGSRDFLNALWFTINFTVVSVISVNVFAFLLALLLTKGLRGTNFFRTAFFMPNLIGGIVLGYIWQLIINGFLAARGVDLTYHAQYGFWGLVVLMNWQMIGYMMIIYIAGLQAVSEDML